MDVRRAEPEDAEEIGRAQKVVVEEGRWLATESPVTAAELADRVRQRRADGHIQLVLEDGGALVGSVALKPTRADGVISLGTWILPGHRGRGGGSALMAAALEARPPGVHKIELEVWPDNEAAIALYRRFGFEQEGLRRDHYRRRDGSLRSSLIMARLFPTDPPSARSQ
jgi:RimJ/RimL family protein N-acetyltransferase